MPRDIPFGWLGGAPQCAIRKLYIETVSVEEQEELVEARQIASFPVASPPADGEAMELVRPTAAEVDAADAEVEAAMADGEAAGEEEEEEEEEAVELSVARACERA